MDRTTYRQARRLIRDNGAHALRWLAPADAQVMRALASQSDDGYSELLFFKRSHAGCVGVGWLFARYRLLNRI